MQPSITRSKEKTGGRVKIVLFDDVKGVVSKYLGGQADKFIERQCRAHLKLQPCDLTKANIPELAKWIGISAGLLMPKEKAEQLKSDIISLS